MKIVLADIPIYCLTCEEDTEKNSRRNHMENQIAPEFVMPIIGIPKNKSGASGFFRMIERGLKAQVRGEPFKPFLMVEDDVSFVMSRNQLEVDVPDDADVLYAGLSNCSMNSYCFHYANYYESVEGFPEVVRVQHMLASHGILVCSALGASALQRTMVEVFLSDKAWDIPLAFLQPYYRVYALRRPWVYQDAEYGGDEACTRITLEGEGNPLPPEFVTKDNVSIRMLE